jgi:hypothetical protein
MRTSIWLSGALLFSATPALAFINIDMRSGGEIKAADIFLDEAMVTLKTECPRPNSGAQAGKLWR